MADKYVDIDTLKYMLYDVHKLEDLLERERFVDHDKESLDMFLESTKDFADRELFPFIKEMDEKPAYHKDGKVYVHSQVETMMKKGGELGFISASFPIKKFNLIPRSVFFHKICLQFSRLSNSLFSIISLFET